MPTKTCDNVVQFTNGLYIPSSAVTIVPSFEGPYKNIGSVEHNVFMYVTFEHPSNIRLDGLLLFSQLNII